MSSVESDSDILLDLLVEWDEARRENHLLSASELCRDRPELIEPLRQRIARRLEIEQLITPSRSGKSRRKSSHFILPSEISVPESIGRYRCERLIGSGGFGLVFLAYDEELKRQVAIKVPHQEFLSSASALEAYRAEARSLAKLEHPNIVPVYDVGSTENFPCFIVSKYIDGENLAQLAKRNSLSIIQIVATIATIAETLHFAHTQGFVHRDVKPLNILLGTYDHPYLIDFGLALHEGNFQESRRYAGTPSYMSPEQARGEAHRVDGRSDIYSLGTVFYELLVGRRPFESENHRRLLAKIANEEPRPPRQINDNVSKELERICLKAISKRVTERYTTARDFADDLRFYLDKLQRPAEVTQRGYSWHGDPTQASIEPEGNANSYSNVIPRGLRSFDEQDAEFFLSLLPGPHDRNGLPESVRFWKHRIEKRAITGSNAVCLLYGPSGSGKSSLVRAGVLPLLDSSVVSIVLDATPESLEAELVKAIYSRMTRVERGLGLNELLASIRRGEGLDVGCKVLLVFDQFEQWLHGANPKQRATLIEALRQCDGIRVQALILVRDDFWMGITRFMRELEVPLVQGENSIANDLFTSMHARKVLTSFGQAWGLLPKTSSDLTTDQQRFLDASIQGLSRDGLVVPVRLALYAEMVKHREWLPSTLKELGGFDGIGVAFLESIFSASTSPPTYRFHQDGARRILRALLPSANVDFRGTTCTREELIRVGEYETRQEQFDELIRILDSELRLITPIEDSSGLRRYQLAHDYLVQSLRQWFERKERETKRGRAMLQLHEIALNWERKPERRFLPTLTEFLSIRFLTRRRDWLPHHVRLMRSAFVFHVSRWGVAIVATIMISIMAQRFLQSSRQASMQAFLESIESSTANRLPAVLRRHEEFPKTQLQQEIQARFFSVPKDDRIRLAFAQAVLGQLNSLTLVEGLGAIEREEIPNLLYALARNRQQALSQIHRVAQDYLAQNDFKACSLLAIVAFYLDDHSIAIEMAESRKRSDHSQRRALIEALVLWPHNMEELIKRTESLDNSSLRSAIFLGLAGIPKEDVPETVKAKWEAVYLRTYDQAPDAATHSAVGVAMFYWGLQLQFPNEARGPQKHRDWYENSAFMTMLRVPIDRSSSDLHQKQDARNQHSPSALSPSRRSLFMCDREVSVLSYRSFIDDPLFPESEKPKLLGIWKPPSPFHPMAAISWTDAVLFCNWLSKKEGLVPCYTENGTKDEFGQLIWTLDTSVSGYRLPSEAEWEAACLAGESDVNALSADPAVLRYVQYNAEGTYPCALHYPNAWGFFDMLGNQSELCGMPEKKDDGIWVHCRGGYAMQKNISSGITATLLPNMATLPAGFRICRELDLESSERSRTSR